jgi:long-chain fatty acid transport protein
MSKLIWAVAALSAGASTATAGGIERTAFSTGLMFEEGNYAAFSLGVVSPSVSGTLGGQASGNMLESYISPSLSYKRQISDKLSLGMILNQSAGANTAYPLGTGYAFAGTTAELKTLSLTGLARYEFVENVSAIAGVRIETLEGVVSGLPLPATLIPPSGGRYDLTTDKSVEVGYIVGVAWEKPELAARVALTYESARSHALGSDESILGGEVPIAASGEFTSVIPQAINLEFQTGVAENTLLFGSVRWVEWSEFDVSPPSLPFPLASYDSDTITYNLGLGRRFNETWSGAITLGYEESTGDVFGNLGPTDGFTSVGAAVTYTQDSYKVTGGLRYVEIGDTDTTAGASFTDNSAIAGGIRVGYYF